MLVDRSSVPFASVTSELVWLCHQLHDFGYVTTTPSLIFCDNYFAIQLATDPTFHEHTKHIEIDYHFI